MLLNDEAMEYFSKGLYNVDFEPPISRYAALALAALEKRKAMPVHHKRTFWRYCHYCPSCTSYLEKEGLKYCPDCGQKLDWSNYESGLKYVR